MRFGSLRSCALCIEHAYVSYVGYCSVNRKAEDEAVAAEKRQYERINGGVSVNLIKQLHECKTYLIDGWGMSEEDAQKAIIGLLKLFYDKEEG